MFKRNNNSGLELRIPAFCFQISSVKKTCFSMTNTLFFGKNQNSNGILDFILYFINKNETLKIRLSGYNPDDDIEDWEEDDEWDDEH